MTLTIEAKDLMNPVWWADAAFAVHADMKSHTGGIMSLGKGAIQSVSKKQKLNAKSFTEAEPTAANDTLTQVSQTRSFLLSQEVNVKDDVSLQNDISAVQLKNNDK